MSKLDATTDAPRHTGELGVVGGSPVAGVVRLLDAGRPASGALAVGSRGQLLGRDTPAGWFGDDDWVSRSHVELRRVAACWVCTDQGSRNGTWVQGDRLEESVTVDSPAVVRLGRSLCWLTNDVREQLRAPVQPASTGPVLGGAMRAVWDEITTVGRASDTLMITGPSGAGKELAARAFHNAHYGSKSAAPFVAVNCATIPAGLAERLLFGAKRGAYSGATQDAEGYLLAAHGGTLFLDELAELDLPVQAKLLRVLESRELIPLGATRAVRVDLRVCAATLRDLRNEVAQGRFREDLYYRIGRPEVRLPALCERLDELPWLIQRTLRDMDPGLSLTVGLLEACALRPWPGNVRELLVEVRQAAYKALSTGESEVRASHLAPGAGLSFEGMASQAPAATSRESGAFPDDETLERALSATDGNVTAAARSLGIHRNQLRRWLEKRRGK